MARQLKISIGQHSDKGRKQTNQDFHGALTPGEPALSSKGVVVALADGISSSAVSAIAAESAVKALMTDYYCTSDAWSVKTSAQRVIAATNSWLHGETMRGARGADRNRGYVCTLSALILKSTTAHLFHIGDSRIFRVAGASLEQLTQDHRVVLSEEESYLGRAMGADHQVEIDYLSMKISAGDAFVLATDGVYEFVEAAFVTREIRAHADDLDIAARNIVAEALRRGGDDNLTVQIVRVDETPEGRVEEVLTPGRAPLPPVLEARQEFDGFVILRELHASSRSHVYLARDIATDRLVALKTPSIDRAGDEAYLRRFLMEEWVARRIDSPHVLKCWAPERRRNFVYVVTEYVEGRTLTQWMIDNPRPDIETVRGLIDQIGKGLRAFHRREMVHQDLRPENILIDKAGTTRIIDFGSTRVAGVAESDRAQDEEILGTAQYTAPEYFLGEPGTSRADLFSLGVIAYQMLTGKLPYGAEVSRARTRAAQRRLSYATALADDREIPAWVDEALRKAVQVDPNRRYEEVSQLLEDLRRPGDAFYAATGRPWIERNPLLFWKLLSGGLAALVIVLLWRLR
jgi:serine/threonine protein phosphatase PrpC